VKEYPVQSDSHQSEASLWLTSIWTTSLTNQSDSHQSEPPVWPTSLTHINLNHQSDSHQSEPPVWPTSLTHIKLKHHYDLHQSEPPVWLTSIWSTSLTNQSDSHQSEPPVWPTSLTHIKSNASIWLTSVRVINYLVQSHINLTHQSDSHQSDSTVWLTSNWPISLTHIDLTHQSDSYQSDPPVWLTSIWSTSVTHILQKFKRTVWPFVGGHGAFYNLFCFWSIKESDKWVSDCVSNWVSEWVSEWVTAWVNVLMSEWQKWVEWKGSGSEIKMSKRENERRQKWKRDGWWWVSGKLERNWALDYSGKWEWVVSERDWGMSESERRVRVSSEWERLSVGGVCESDWFFALTAWLHTSSVWLSSALTKWHTFYVWLSSALTAWGLTKWSLTTYIVCMTF
jgi:hypothetical protein